jgi:hypothetical protein
MGCAVRSLVRKNWLIVCLLLVAVAVATLLGILVHAQALAAVAAGTATVTVVLGFELLRRREVHDSRQDEYAELLKIADPLDIRVLTTFISDLGEVLPSMTKPLEDDIVEFLDAVVRAEKSEIPLFRTLAKDLFDTTIASYAGATAPSDQVPPTDPWHA